MPNQIWDSISKHPCPSCAALNGQVHKAKTFAEQELKPKSDKLFCTHYCSCTLKETDLKSNGNLKDVPIRRKRSNAVKEQSIEQNQPMQLQAKPNKEGFEIIAIAAGEAKGHGITFTADVLSNSLSLWDGQPVKIDHHSFFDSPSLRNLAGTVSNPTWDASTESIRMQLTPGGPAKNVLLEIRESAKENADIMKAVGFSAHLFLKLNRETKEVKEITSVSFVDAVINPAAGGKFLQELHKSYSDNDAETHAEFTASKPNAMKENNVMAEKKDPKAKGAESPEAKKQAEIKENQLASAELKKHSEEMTALEEQAKESEEILIAQCGDLLTSALSNSHLPDLTQERIKKQFEGKRFRAAELTSVINAAREEVAALTAGSIIRGSSRAEQMFNGDDAIRAAAFDMFGAPRDEGTEKLKVARLNGLKELYLMLTGDLEFTGNVATDLAYQFATTTNFPAIVKDTMNKLLVKSWDANGALSYGWWKKIVTIEHFTDLNTVDWVITGTVGSLPTVAERGEYTNLPIGDSVETSSWTKSGGYIPLTLEAILRDDLQAFKSFPKELSDAGLRNISEKVAAIFTDNSGVGPTLADTGALFNATAIATTGGHLNLLTTALGTTYAAWDTVAAAVYNQPLHVAATIEGTSYLATGKKQAVDPSICLVPRALTGQAEALFRPRWANDVESVATSGGPTYGGKVDPVTVPEWTDADNWAALIDPNVIPGVMIGEMFGVMPQIILAGRENDPAMFMNDESRLKVRQFLNVGVSNYRPMHKSNV